MPERLYRSKSKRMLGGICGGLAEYFLIDVTLIRVLWVLASFYGAGVLVYLICWIVIPEEPKSTTYPAEVPAYGEMETPRPGERVETDDTVPNVPDGKSEGTTARMTDRLLSRRRSAGVALIIIGLFIFLIRSIPHIPWNGLWPLVIIAAGVILIWQSFNGRRR